MGKVSIFLATIRYYAVCNYGRGERITAQYPILINGKPIYYVQVVQPTAHIY